MLKSDQNGIEIVLTGTYPYAAGELKSDQNGIEIRRCHGEHRGQPWLKSDQNGIEMVTGTVAQGRMD